MGKFQTAVAYSKNGALIVGVALAGFPHVEHGDELHLLVIPCSKRIDAVFLGEHLVGV